MYINNASCFTSPSPSAPGPALISIEEQLVKLQGNSLKVNSSQNIKF